MVIFSIGGDSIIARTAGRPAKTGGHALPRVLDMTSYFSLVAGVHVSVIHYLVSVCGSATLWGLPVACFL